MYPCTLFFSYVFPMVLIMIFLSRTSYHIQKRERAQSALHREENGETAELINQQIPVDASRRSLDHHFAK